MIELLKPILDFLITKLKRKIVINKIKKEIKKIKLTKSDENNRELCIKLQYKIEEIIDDSKLEIYKINFGFWSAGYVDNIRNNYLSTEQIEEILKSYHKELK